MIYQYPLFRSDEFGREEACKYLAKNMLDSGMVKVMEINENFIHKEFNKEGRDEMYQFLQEMIANTCHFMYGVNASQMANFLIVSHMVDEKLMPALTKYMKHVGLDYKLISFIPSEFVQPYLAEQSKKFDFKPLERWDPSVYWDFSEKQVPEFELTNPLNGFTHMTLYLPKIDNKSFLLSLQKNGILSREQILKNNWKFEELELKLLPYNTFNKVLNIANAIFRHY